MLYGQPGHYCVARYSGYDPLRKVQATVPTYPFYLLAMKLARRQVLNVFGLGT